MTTNVEIINRALQSIGTRTTVTAAELAAQSTNEAIQAALIYQQNRDDLLRMAPWDCGFNMANLAYITSIPGTPENITGGTELWQKGQPAPPWTYEYQYPVDCLRACWIVPQFQTGFAGGVPITTAITGGIASYGQGPPAKFKVSVDQFIPVTAATFSAPGTGYAVGDLITLASGALTSPPIGAPVVLEVDAIGVGGAIVTLSVVNQIQGSDTPKGGSYFAQQTNPVAQGTTTGSGTGATFTLTYGTKGDQRVILTNQELATLAYVKQITDPNVMDSLFQTAWIASIASSLAMALTGDKGLANSQVEEVNAAITEARKADANEGMTMNDVTPDWVRIRGVSYSDYSYTPNSDFSWGAVWPTF
jgi:hypothetical protein